MRNRHPALARALRLAAFGAVFTLGARIQAQATTVPNATIDGAPARLDTAAILADAKPDIDAGNAAWVPGLAHHDAAMITAAYADSAMFIAADGTVTRGRGAIARLYASRFRHLRAIRDGRVVPDGLTVIATTTIVEWGHAWIDQAPASGTGVPVRSGGSYLTVWTREADGHWHITRNLTL